MSEEMSGKILGSEFSVSTQNIIQVLLIVLIAGLGWLGYSSIQESRKMNASLVHDRFTRMEAQLATIANAIRVLDYNVANPDNRYPIDFGPDIFRHRGDKMSDYK